jgi:ABC-type branched-subunit amino acid transport system substrate-binding protein
VYTVYAATSAQVLLEAIANSDGSREDVIAKLFEVNVDTAVGTLSFDENGDPAEKVESIYAAENGQWTWKETVAVS